MMRDTPMTTNYSYIKTPQALKVFQKQRKYQVEIISKLLCTLTRQQSHQQPFWNAQENKQSNYSTKFYRISFSDEHL